VSQEKFLKSLMDLGLKKSEAKVYFYLSKRGPKQANEIIKALKMKKQQLYPLIKNLQNKAIVESSLDRPARFSAVSFEKVLDLFAKAKMEEAKIIQQNKDNLLSDWQSINLQHPQRKTANFIVIKGKKYVYSKIQQMIQETNKQLSVISNLSDLIRSEQNGVLDTIQNHPKKNDIQFRIITEIPKQHIQAIKRLLESINPQIQLKGRNTDHDLSLFPKMVIRDNEEILYFITTRIDEGPEQEIESCLFTNCKSLIKPLSIIFENLWKGSKNIKQKIREIELGKELPRTIIIKDIDKTRKKYLDVLGNAKKEILIVTSSNGLSEFQKSISNLKSLIKNKISLRIMSPIINENFMIAKEMAAYGELRHIRRNLVDTIIVDDDHLFQFKRSTSFEDQNKSTQSSMNTLYTTNLKYIKKKKRILDSIWVNSSRPSLVPVENINPLDSFSLSKKTFLGYPSSEIITNHLKRKPVVDKSVYGELTEEQIVNKIISKKNYANSSRRIIECYCKIGYAAINPPKQLNLPKMLIQAIQIDKKSSFGAEDRIVFHIMKKTKEGLKYVPVAIVGDNPKSVKILHKGQYHNTPAEKNHHLVKKEEIQFQHYGKIFLAHWSIPIPLIPDQLSFPSGTLILESYGKVIPKRVHLRYPMDAEYEAYYNAFDSFVTLMYESARYTGSGTDGFFLRDTYVEISFPKKPN